MNGFNTANEIISLQSIVHSLCWTNYSPGGSVWGVSQADRQLWTQSLFSLCALNVSVISAHVFRQSVFALSAGVSVQISKRVKKCVIAFQVESHFIVHNQMRIYIWVKCFFFFHYLAKDIRWYYLKRMCTLGMKIVFVIWGFFCNASINNYYFLKRCVYIALANCIIGLFTLCLILGYCYTPCCKPRYVLHL